MVFKFINGSEGWVVGKLYMNPFPEQLKNDAVAVEVKVQAVKEFTKHNTLYPGPEGCALKYV